MTTARDTDTVPTLSRRAFLTLLTGDAAALAAERGTGNSDDAPSGGYGVNGYGNSGYGHEE